MNHIFTGKVIFLRNHCISGLLHFKDDNEIDIAIIGNKTTNFHKQKPVCNGSFIVSETNDGLQSGYYLSPLGYKIVKWFVKEVLKHLKWFSLLGVIKKIL